MEFAEPTDWKGSGSHVLRRAFRWLESKLPSQNLLHVLSHINIKQNKKETYNFVLSESKFG